MDITTGPAATPGDSGDSGDSGDDTKADTGNWTPTWDLPAPPVAAPAQDPPPPEALTIRELTTTLVPAEQAHPLYARIGGKLHPIREISVMPRRAIVVLELDNDSGE
jgi:hypothetical protein